MKQGRSLGNELEPTEDAPIISSPLQNLVNSIVSGNETLTKSHLASLSSEYQNSPQLILKETSKILGSDTTSLVSLFKLLATTRPVDTLPTLTSQFLELQTKPSPSSSKVLNQTVQVVAQLLPISIQPATGKSEAELIEILIKNAIKLIPAADKQSWEDAENWLGNGFYKSFKNLTKPEVFNVLVSTFGSTGELLSAPQLGYLAKRYYDCADMKAVLHEGYGEENFFSFTKCNEAVRRSSQIYDSIYAQVVAESKIQNAEADDIVQSRINSILKIYPTPGTNRTSARPYAYTINDDNLWLRYILDAVFRALDSSTTTCDLPCTGRLLRLLHPLYDNLLRYPFITTVVRTNVTNLYNKTPQDIRPLIKYITRLPKALEKLATSSLVSLLTDKSTLSDDQEVLLAHQLVQFDLQNESLWNKIPDQAKLLASAVNKTAVQWNVLVDDEVLQVYGQNDSTLGLRAPNSNETHDQVWAIQSKFAVGRVHFRMYLVETSTGEYGRLHYDPQGGLRHELRAPRFGNYAFAVQINETESFNMRYVASRRPICVIRDESGGPAGLDECTGDDENDEPANFMLKVNQETDLSEALKNIPS